MKDPLMENILKGFDQAGQDRYAQQASTNHVNGHVAVNDSGSMLAILEKFDDVNPVTEEHGINSGPGPQSMPHLTGKNKMEKAGSKAHPAKGKLVGESDDESDDEEEQKRSPKYDLGPEEGRRSKYDQAPSDPKRSKYDEDTISPKQSISDILRSMEEADEEKAQKLKDELHDEMHPRKLERNEKGTYDLAEYEKLKEMRGRLSAMLESIDQKLNRYGK